MRAKDILIEYNIASLIDIFGDKLMAKWQAEGEPFKDSISNNDVVTAEDLMKWMEQYDPTQNNKYITWMVNKYAGKKGGIARIEDIPTQLADVLDTYEKLSRKNLLKPEHKNINQIKTLTDLHDIVDKYKEADTASKQETSKAEEQEFYDNDEAELVFNNNEYKIVIPKTQEASCYFGKNTRWCTTGRTDNIFDEYNEQGPLYIILHKATNEKWQWHFESGQYMDARDEHINIDKFLKKHKVAANAVIKDVNGLERAATLDPSNWFKYIKNPSEEMQLAAVKQYVDTIQHIKNPSEAVQLVAVKENGYAIQYIKNPSEEVQLAAVKPHGLVIQDIEKPTEKVRLAAVTEYWTAIQHIENPSEAVQLAAVKQNGQAMQWIKNPSEEMQLAVVKRTASAIEHIKNPSKEVQLAAVERSGWTITYIENPSEELQLAAVKQDRYAIEFIENPTEAVKRAAQGNNNESVDVDLNRLQTLSGIMRAKNFLIEYNMTSLVNLFGDKLMAKWQAEGEPFRDSISDNDEVTAEDLMKWMEQYDPTQNNKYITWIVNKYAGKKGGIARLEDIPTQLTAVLDTYEKLSRKNLLKSEHKNINQIKTLNDLHDIVDEYKEEDTSSKQETTKAEEQEFYDNDEAELVFNNNEYKIVIPKTETASCYFGKNTRWCTTGDNNNMFADYNEDGPLYVILHKPTNEKWQWHFESKQYMDARDEWLNMDKFLKKHKVAASAVIKHVGGLEKAVAVDPTSWFRYIKNPSEELQLASVKENGHVIKHIKNASEAVQSAAIKQNIYAIKDIKNPSEELQLVAVKQHGSAIEWIKNPSEEVQVAAVRKYGSAIRYIKNPSEATQIAAVNHSAYAIQHIENPSEEVQLAAVKEDGHAIKHIENSSEEVQLAAVKQDGNAIQHIENLSEEVQLAAVKKNGHAIRWVKNPSEEVQLAAVKQNSRAILYIKNPSEEVRLVVVKQGAREHNNESIDFDLNRLQALSGIKQ